MAQTDKQMTTTKKTKWWIWALIAAIILLITAAILKNKSKPKGTEVVVEKAELRDITETVSASGKIYPEKEIKISSDVSGEIVELYVEEGDSVKAGQIIARINPDVYLSAVERSSAGVNAARSQAGASKVNINAAEAQKDQVKAQVENARKVYARNKKLFSDGIISQADLEASEAQLKNLESSLRSAESNIEAIKKQSQGSSYQVKDAEAVLKEQRTNLGRTTIKAPAAGIISKLNVEKGERVVGTMQMSGTEMMRIADLNAMEVQVEVSENDIVRVNIGDEADIEVDAYQNKKFTGRVTEVSNSASNLGTGIGGSISTDQVTKFIVKVRIEKESYADLVTGNNAAPFKPGMSATVEIKTSKVENVLSIPIQAVVAYDPDAELKKKKEKEKAAEGSIAKTEKKVAIKENPFIEAVFILMGDTVHRVDVKTGIQDQNFIEIISGLKEGDEVVTGPYVAISRELKSGNKAHRKKEESDEKKKK